MMCESEMGGLSWLGPVQRPVHQAHDTLHVIFGSLSHQPDQRQTLRFPDSPSESGKVSSSVFIDGRVYS